MKLPKELFWELNRRSPDFDKYPDYVIIRVIERGEWEDVKAIFKYYGSEKIKEALLQTRYLPKKQLSFWSLYFDIPKKKFRCYRWQQLNPGRWDY